jgi:hypothetical protein
LGAMCACMERRELLGAGSGGWGMFIRLKWPPPKLFRLTMWPLGRMWARAHLAPNLQFPLHWRQKTVAEMAMCSAAVAYLGKILARCSLGDRLIRVKERASFASLASSLTVEFAGHVRGACSCQPLH